jgi:hypothetical protein
MKQNFIPHVASRCEREGDLAGLKGSLLPQKKKEKKKERDKWLDTCPTYGSLEKYKRGPIFLLAHSSSEREMRVRTERKEERKERGRKEREEEGNRGEKNREEKREEKKGKREGKKEWKRKEK